MQVEESKVLGDTAGKRYHTGLEALRILAMLLIVGRHYLLHSGVLNEVPDGTNYWIAWLLNAIVIVGVNCYVLISGYFLIESNHFKWKKVIHLWGTIFFYVTGIYLFCAVMGWAPFSWRSMLKVFFPIKLTTYWFATVYLGLYVIYPYLNMISRQLDKRAYQRFLLILLLICSIYSFAGDTFHVVGGYSLIWFIVLYYTGGYIRRFFAYENRPRIAIGYVLMTLAVFVSKVVLTKASMAFGFHGKGAAVFYEYNAPTIFFTAVALFLLFKTWKIKNEFLVKGINFFAPLTFGVYLLHDNTYIKPLLWRQWVDVASAYQSAYFIGHFLLMTILVFVLCACIEKGRQMLFASVQGLMKENWNKAWTIFRRKSCSAESRD